MIIGYNHAQISVPPDTAQQVRAFYGKLLGLPEIPVPIALQGRGLIWFKVGDRELHVAIEEDVDRTATRAHLAYEVDNIAKLRGRLASERLELIEQPKIEGFDRFHIRDPFGNRVEFMGRVPE
jgi:catechol 2,3-dioxygenase-like lactoylglutathione lyase family enzyme